MLEERPLVLRCKVAVVGDATVGKTALVQMFCSGNTNFAKDYQMTPAAEFRKHEVPLDNGKTVVELYMIDAGGHDLFRDSAPANWEGAAAAILVYDCTSRASFQHLADWVTRLKSTADLTKVRDGLLNAIVVAAKDDLATERLAVKPDEAEAWARQQGMGFCKTSSAPPGRDVDAPFKFIAMRHADAYETAMKRYDAAGKR